MCRFQSSQANIKISALCFPFVVHRTSCAVHFKLSCRYKVEAKPAARYFALLWGSEMKFYFTNRLLTRSNWRKKKSQFNFKKKIILWNFYFVSDSSRMHPQGDCCMLQGWKDWWSQQGYATLCLTEALKTFRVLHAFVVEAVLENVLGNKDNRRWQDVLSPRWPNRMFLYVLSLIQSAEELHVNKTEVPALEKLQKLHS